MTEYFRHIVKLPSKGTAQDHQATVQKAYEETEEKIRDKAEEAESEEPFIAMMRDVQEIHENDPYIVIHAYLTTEHKPGDEEFEEARGRSVMEDIEVVDA